MSLNPSQLIYSVLYDEEMSDALEIIFRKIMKFQSLNSRSCRNSKQSMY